MGYFTSKIKVVIIFLFIASTNYSQCTTFCFCVSDTILFGNTLDWYFNDGLIIVNKRNVSKTALGFSNPAKWTSKYGSITINQWGREFPQRGMNEAGLAVGEMTLGETIFPEPDSRQVISNPQWIQYQLDNCSTVEEVIGTDSLIRIDPNEYHSHFLVADKNGNCVTMEWLNGKLVYHTKESLPLKVLTNSTYKSLVEFYKQGKPHAENDYCSLARFYRAANLIQNYIPLNNVSILEYAWKIHSSVNNPGWTKWILLFDIKNLRLYFKTNLNNNVRYVDFNFFDFSCDTPVKMLDINSSGIGDVYKSFMDFDPFINSALIRKMSESHEPITGPVSEWYIEHSAKYPETTECTGNSTFLK